MKWQELCERPELQNLPFRIELDEHVVKLWGFGSLNGCVLSRSA